MTSNSSPFMSALALALMPGPALEPAALLTALEAKGAPLGCFAGDDGTASVWAAVGEDFDFLRALWVRPADAGSAEMERWAALMRWSVATVKDWKPSDDPAMRLLVAALVTSRMCGGDTGLWRLLADSDAPSPGFLAALSLLVSKFQVVFSIREIGAPSIWEGEFVEAFQEADAGGDWIAVADMWPRFAHVLRPDILLTEMVRCLARYDFAGLVRAADALQQSQSIMQLIHTLAVDQRLRLAVASTSERVRFCCAFVTVARGTGAPSLSPDEEAALIELLVKVAESTEEWRKWMAAFSRYSLRYPALHRSLGDALAHASQDAAAIYIESIKLYSIQITSTDESRSLISECLRAFGHKASADHRHAVWAQAYRRWLGWRFGAEDPSTHLFDVNRSPIDFAIFSYVRECMSAADRDRSIAEIQRSMSEIELNWCRSESECITEWNRLLSLFQPYARAYCIISDGEGVLYDKEIYYPFDVSKSMYHRIRFRMSGFASSMST